MARTVFRRSIFNEAYGLAATSAGGSAPNLSGSIPMNLPGSIFTNLAGSVSTGLRSQRFAKLLVFARCALACTLVQMPALAQHRGAPMVGGGRYGSGVRVVAPRIVTPPVSGAMIPRPRNLPGVHMRGAGLHIGGVGLSGFQFGQSPIYISRPRPFFNRPSLRFTAFFAYSNLWWPTCGSWLSWGPGWPWAEGFNCYPLSFNSSGFENYVAMPTYESPVYVYGEAERELVWLYLKDGTVYSVTDYWFVKNQMHFNMLGEELTKRREHVIPYDELDVQKTIYVNTHRGFRIVFRDEPWQQYLKDHPDSIPTDVPPPQGK